mgnify:FL=1
MYECVANDHERLSGMSRTHKTIQMQFAHVLYFYTGGTKSYVLCQNNSLVGYDIEAADAFTIIGPRALPDGRDVCTLVITLPRNGAMIDLLFSSEERLTSASCEPFPFDIHTSNNQQSSSLLENYGQRTCSVMSKGDVYDRWTGLWIDSGPIYLTITGSQTRLGFSLNMKSK